MTLLTGIESEVLPVLAVNATVTVATTPLPIALESRLNAKQAIDPAAGTQLSALFATASAGPATILNEVTSLAG